MLMGAEDPFSGGAVIMCRDREYPDTELIGNPGISDA